MNLLLLTFFFAQNSCFGWYVDFHLVLVCRYSDLILPKDLVCLEIYNIRNYSPIPCDSWAFYDSNEKLYSYYISNLLWTSLFPSISMGIFLCVFINWKSRISTQVFTSLFTSNKVSILFITIENRIWVEIVVWFGNWNEVSFLSITVPRVCESLGYGSVSVFFGLLCNGCI